MLDLFRELEGIEAHAVSTFVTRRLVDRFPGRSVAMTQDPHFDIEQWARHSSHVPLTQPTAGVNVRALHDDGSDLDAGHTLFRWRDR